MKVNSSKEIIKFEYENIPTTNRELAKKHGVTASYICQLAKKNLWKKADKQSVDKGGPAIPDGTLYDPGLKKNDLLANMTIDMAERMVNELHCYTPIIGQIERWIVEATRDDANDKRRQVMLKAVSFSQRANDLKTLANILVQTRGVIMSGIVIGEGKKAQQDAKADVAVTGKFAPSAPPTLKAVKK